MNGLYNGEKGLSHRARIPNYLNLQIDICSSSSQTSEVNQNQCIYQLNTKTGMFHVKYKSKFNEYEINHYIYPHRYYNRAIIQQFTIQRINNNYKGKIVILVLYFFFRIVD